MRGDVIIRKKLPDPRTLLANERTFLSWLRTGIALMARLTELCTEPEDWVWDPMMGSGTTLVAAISKGRHAFGGDSNAEALRLTQMRLGDLSNS